MMGWYLHEVADYSLMKLRDRQEGGRSMEAEITDNIILPEREEGESVSWKSINGISHGTISRVLGAGEYMVATNLGIVIVNEGNIVTEAK